MNLNRSILPFAVVALLVACSQQGEGERCVRTNGNADCGSGLVCWEAEKLVEYDTNKEFAAERCCPPKEANVWSDSRCDKSSKDNKTTTPSATAGAAGSASVGSAGTSEAQAGGGSSSGGAGGENAGAAGTVDETAGSSGSAGSGA